MYPYGVTAPNGAKSGVEFTAFNSFALHQQHLNDIVNEVLAGHSVQVSDLTDSDIEYIEKEVARRI